MNRHAVAFVSVFSLALVLSVYYLMIPKGGPTQGVGNISSGGNVEVEGARSYYFEALAREREESYASEVAKLESALVNAATNSEKADILNDIQLLKDTYDSEKAADKAIAEFGWPLAYVRIGSDEIVVVVYEPEPDAKKAAQIIRQVMISSDLDLPVSLEFKS